MPSESSPLHRRIAGELDELRHALTKQFQRFFEFDDIELVFAEDSLEAIADNLEMSAETLKRHRRRRSEAADEEPAVVTAIRADKGLTARQRQTRIDGYQAFRASSR